MVFCHKCGTESDDDSNFCINCGTELRKSKSGANSSQNPDSDGVTIIWDVPFRIPPNFQLANSSSETSQGSRDIIKSYKDGKRSIIVAVKEFDYKIDGNDDKFYEIAYLYNRPLSIKDFNFNYGFYFTSYLKRAKMHNFIYCKNGKIVTVTTTDLHLLTRVIV